MKIIFATANKGKLREASEILGPVYELLTPADFGITEDIPETGDTLMANSIQKAEYVYARTGLDCFADDTGLEVDALGGAPGVRSARYAGDGHDFEANIVKLLSELDRVGADTPEKRSARFRCVVTLIKDGEKHFFDGRMDGHIAMQKTGTKGFGYDPVFVADAFPEATMGELGEEYKNSVSHRGNSLRALRAWLEEHQ